MTTTPRAMAVSAVCVLTMLIAGCAQPAPFAPRPLTQPQTSPTPAPDPVQTSEVSGTVFVRDLSGVRALNGATLFGWTQVGGTMSSIGRIAADRDGRYSVRVPTNAGLRLFTGDNYSQPCAASVTPAATSRSRDIVLIADPTLLGGGLPADTIAGTRTVSGTVYEASSGNRKPVSGAFVMLDGLAGLELMLATTVTDASGRYELCGLDTESSAYVSVYSAGLLGHAQTTLSGNAQLDIEVRRN